MASGELTLKQAFQKISGTLANGGNTTPIEGSLHGETITFTAGGTTYTGRVNGNSMSGEVKGGNGGKWSATKK